ncbi:MAG: permease-like cell division protein FtsX [bacterium]
MFNIFFVLGICLIFFENVDRYFNDLKKEIKIEVFLKNSDENNIHIFCDCLNKIKLNNMKIVENIEFITSEQSTQNFMTQMKIDEEMGLKKIFLPSFFKVHFKNIDFFSELEKVINIIKKNENVEDIIYSSEWLKNFYKTKELFAKIKMILFILIGLLGISFSYEIIKIFSQQKIKKARIFVLTIISGMISFLFLFLICLSLKYFGIISLHFLSFKYIEIFGFCVIISGILSFFSFTSVSLQIPSLFEEKKVEK